MEKDFREGLVLALLIILFCSAARADGLAVPVKGGFSVLDGKTLAVVRAVEMGGEDVPKLAVHPSSPILAGLSGQRLVFWNLPSFAEASTHSDSLFAGVTELGFSPDGTTLYLLSDELRAVIKFDLASSRVSGTLPIPGGPPLWMKAYSSGVLVGQDDTLSLLSPNAEKGLLAQFRFAQKVSSALMIGENLLVARAGLAGIDSYQALTGRAVQFMPTASGFKQLVGSGGGSFYALGGAGDVSAWTTDALRPRWTHSSSPLVFDGIAMGGENARVYAFDLKGQTLVALDSALGNESARTTLAPGAVWPPVIFADF